jgi:hypothetical protein
VFCVFELCCRFGENQSLPEQSSAVDLRSSTLMPIAACPVCLHLTVSHLCASAQQTDARAHCAFMLDCTLVTIKHTNRRLHAHFTHAYAQSYLNCARAHLRRLHQLTKKELSAILCKFFCIFLFKFCLCFFLSFVCLFCFCEFFFLLVHFFRTFLFSVCLVGDPKT